MFNAANYAQQCYSENTTGALDCTKFVQDRLAFTSISNASCPFDDSMCRSDNSNLLLDSGLIGSDDLGLNLPPEQRMFYREQLHCAPLQTQGFATDANTAFDNYTRYFYGSHLQVADDLGPYNWTYEVEDIDAQYGRKQADNPYYRDQGQGLGLL